MYLTLRHSAIITTLKHLPLHYWFYQICYDDDYLNNKGMYCHLKFCHELPVIFMYIVSTHTSNAVSYSDFNLLSTHITTSREDQKPKPH